MKPGDAGYERKLAYIASRADRFLIPKDSWGERDWRQHRLEARERRAESLREMRYRPMGDQVVIPPPGPKSAMTTLFPKPRDPSRGFRSDAIDRLLEKHIGRR